MYPRNEARDDYPAGKELAPHAFPCSEPPPAAAFSSDQAGCSSRQEAQYGLTAVPYTAATSNAVMPPPWRRTCTSSSVGGFTSAGAADISTDQIMQDELKSTISRFWEFSSSEEKSFYPCRVFLNSDENLETKLHDVGSSWNPESLGHPIQKPASAQTASSFYCDTESRIQTTSFLPQQGSLIQTAPVTNPVSTDGVDLLQGMEATEDKETHILVRPQVISSMPTRSDIDNSCPSYHKREIVEQEYCSWDSNWSAEHHDHHLTDHYHFGENRSCLHDVSDSAVISTNDLVNYAFFRPQFTVGCHHVVSYPYPCIDVKELEEREWTKLLQKELTNSDVGSLGRIVLPKKEAEANLPPLLEKDGLVLEMVDMANHVVWGFKYRFWPNNRSRMYILENTGDFAKMNKLEIGDSFVIYGDRVSRYYLVGVEKKATLEEMITGNGAIDVNKVRPPERKRR